MLRLGACAILLASTAGCATIDPEMIERKTRAYLQNSPEFHVDDVSAYTENNLAVLGEFAVLAGVATRENTEPSVITYETKKGRRKTVRLPDSKVDINALREWRPVLDAGIDYVDQRCERFMDSLFWFNRVRQTMSRQVQYGSAAVTAALTIVEASKTAIGLTPLGFTLVDQTINNLGSGLLYNLNPSTISELVKKRQKAFLEKLSPSYTSRMVALKMIQDYATICLPPSIETEVERAINAKEYQPARLDEKTPPSPEDKDPDDFPFGSVEGQTGTVVESEPVRIAGIGSPALVHVLKGKYRIDGKGDWTSKDGLIANGQTIELQGVVAASDGEEEVAEVRVGRITSKLRVKVKPASVAASPAPPVESPESDKAAETGAGAAATPVQAKPLIMNEAVNAISTPR